MGFNYVPVTGTAPDTHLDGAVSFMPVLQSLKERSKRIIEAAGGHEVPLLLFLDWPTASGSPCPGKGAWRRNHRHATHSLPAAQGAGAV
jgi:hypothetical protein